MKEDLDARALQQAVPDAFEHFRVIGDDLRGTQGARAVKHGAVRGQFAYDKLGHTPDDLRWRVSRRIVAADGAQDLRSESAQKAVSLNQEHARALPGGSQSGSGAGRSPADDQDVGLLGAHGGMGAKLLGARFPGRCHSQSLCRLVFG